MEGRRKAMPDWEVLLNGDVIGTVLSGVISPSLENQPIGFAGINCSLEPETPLQFRQRGRDNLLVGKAAEIPFVPLTSRKKIGPFLE
jgi:hypothetical protein